MDKRDDALWRRYTRGIKPLKRAERLPTPMPSAGEGRSSACEAPAALRRVEAVGPRQDPPTPQTRIPIQDRSILPALAPGIAHGVDKRTLARLKRGLIPPEGQIDLHRMTQAEAHAALVAFVTASQGAGRRCVLVITGKGYGTDGHVGVLKSAVPRWLNEPAMRARTLAIAHSPATLGGEGALLVLLRRVRK